MFSPAVRAFRRCCPVGQASIARGKWTRAGGYLGRSGMLAGPGAILVLALTLPGCAEMEQEGTSAVPSAGPAIASDTATSGQPIAPDGPQVIAARPAMTDTSAGAEAGVVDEQDVAAADAVVSAASAEPAAVADATVAPDDTAGEADQLSEARDAASADAASDSGPDQALEAADIARGDERPGIGDPAVTTTAAAGPGADPGFVPEAAIGDAEAAPEEGADTGAIDPDFVPAPEIFDATVFVLWDGKLTFPGVWLALRDLDRSLRARVVDPNSGRQIDAKVYGDTRPGVRDIAIISSGAAQALGLTPGKQARLRLFGVRPRFSIGRDARKSTDPELLESLAGRIKAMEPNELLQLVAAAMRGKGYATTFEAPAAPGQLSSIRAFPLSRETLGTQVVRVYVRPGSKRPMTALQLNAVVPAELGPNAYAAVVSIAGFATKKAQSDSGGVIRLDLDDLIDIWLTHYDEMPGPDRELLPLRPSG